MINYDLTASNRKGLDARLDQLDCTKTVYSVIVKPKKSKRSELQNALSHSWYVELAQKLDSDNADGWKCYCKLHHGVPIMRRDDDEFREVYDTALKGLTYEKKIQVMKILPVTSLMNTVQLNEYLENVQADFESKGVFLLFPNEVHYESN